MSKLQQRVNVAVANLERAQARVAKLRAVDVGSLEASNARVHTDAAARAVAELNDAERELDRAEATQRARTLIPPFADARGSLRSDSVYRPDTPGRSFFRDLVSSATRNDPEAWERLTQHQREVTETRDVTTADPGMAGFIPPIYLGDMWIDKERPGRPFANAVAKMPLPERGKTMTFPRVATAPEVEVQAAELDVVNEIDIDSEDYEVPKVTIAGMNDTSIQALEWAEPQSDTIILRELVRSYDSKLDSQLLAGSGANGQHEGLRNVTGIISKAFASGGADALLGTIYEAVSDVATLAPGFEANAVVMHPRRAAWMASHRDALSNLFQQGALPVAAGSQDDGFAGPISGLQVIRDGNIQTNLGTNTNEDEVYLVVLEELILAEGELRTRVLQEPLSGTLAVRIQAFGFSAFAGGRRPKVIARISGAGLTSPVFPSS